MDQKTGKTLYDSSAGEVFSKNFLVGFSRGLGGFVMTLVSWGVIYFILVSLILPQLTGTISQLTNVLKLIPTTKGTGSTLQIPDSILKQVEQIQKGK